MVACDRKSLKRGGRSTSFDCICKINVSNFNYMYRCHFKTSSPCFQKYRKVTIILSQGVLTPILQCLQLVSD